MEGMELICCQIISAVGTARADYIEAMQEAREGHFDKAEELMEEGRKAYGEGHQAHFQLITQEANGEKVETSLLLSHAEDQLMSAEGFGIIARELIENYKLLYSKTK